MESVRLKHLLFSKKTPETSGRSLDIRGNLKFMTQVIIDFKSIPYKTVSYIPRENIIIKLKSIYS